MLKLIKRNYWGPEIKGYIKKYVQGCTKYQQNKVQHIKKAGELYLLETPNRLWQDISIDIIGLLLKQKRQDVIVVIINQFTKMISLKVTTTTILSKNTAKIYRDEI